MAFSNYSNLFRCGLLSEGSSPPHASAPWAAEYCGPRRGSLPSIDSLSEISDASTLPLPPPNSTGHDASDSFPPIEDSLYFTFKKKRNPAEHRSFLSLDLAESQSLRSVNVKGKDVMPRPTERMYQPGASNFSPTYHQSFVPVFSPPPPFSPSDSPTSTRDVSDHLRLIVPEPSSSCPRRPASILHAPSPRYTNFAFPASPSLPQRDLSPMRFADPSPPPLNDIPFDADSTSEKSVRSADVLSRSSTASSGYRRAQRKDALHRLEGRGADGAVGRLKPRLSQNFMHLSDDEDEESTIWSARKSMKVIVEDLTEEEVDQPRPSGTTSGTSSIQGLSVSINNQPWYNLTPRQSAWGVLFGGEVDGDIDTEVDKIFGLDEPLYQPDSPQSDDSCTSRRPKRSKRSYSPRRIARDSMVSVIPVSFPNRTPTQQPAHLHPLDRTASSASSITPPPRHPPSHVPSKSVSLQHGSRIRPRTVSDFGSSNPHTLVHETRSRTTVRQTRKPPRLELRLDILPLPFEEPSFIDMRDESLETESRSDSWHSLFEVACAV